MQFLAHNSMTGIFIIFPLHLPLQPHMTWGCESLKIRVLMWGWEIAGQIWVWHHMVEDCAPGQWDTDMRASTTTPSPGERKGHRNCWWVGAEMVVQHLKDRAKLGSWARSFHSKGTELNLLRNSFSQFFWNNIPPALASLLGLGSWLFNNS